MHFAGLEEFSNIKTMSEKVKTKGIWGVSRQRISGPGHSRAQLPGCVSAVEGSPGVVPTVCPVSVLLGAVFLQLTLLTCKHNSCYVLNLGGFHILRLLN